MLQRGCRLELVRPLDRQTHVTFQKLSCLVPDFLRLFLTAFHQKYAHHHSPQNDWVPLHRPALLAGIGDEHGQRTDKHS